MTGSPILICNIGHIGNLKAIYASLFLYLKRDRLPWWILEDFKGYE